MKELSDEYIIGKIDEVFDEIVWELKDKKRFITRFNRRIREVIPELKDVDKNFYKLYNEHQPQ